MDRDLVYRLVLPLVAATAFMVLLHLWWQADGFFLNLAAGFVGSLVTVAYIDAANRRRESRRWSSADGRIAHRLRTLSSATITGVRTAFGIPFEDFVPGTSLSADLSEMSGEVRRAAASVLIPHVHRHVAALDRKGWTLLADNLTTASEHCGVVLERFAYRLEPDVVAIVLDLQESLNAALSYRSILPDVAGVPVEELPRALKDPAGFQRAFSNISADEIVKALRAAVALGDIATKLKVEPAS